MARRHPKECKVCGARAPFVSISATGLCPIHGHYRLAQNLHGLIHKVGPAWDEWQRGMLRAAGVVLVPDDEDERVARAYRVSRRSSSA